MHLFLGCYDARMRVLIKHVAWQLKVSWDVVEETEVVMAETLEYSTYTASEYVGLLYHFT